MKNQENVLFYKKPYEAEEPKDDCFKVKTDGLVIRTSGTGNKIMTRFYEFETETKHDGRSVIYGTVLNGELFKKCIAGDKELSEFFLKAERKNSSCMEIPYSSDFLYNNIHIKFCAPKEQKKFEIVVGRNDYKPLSLSLSNPAWVIRLKHYLENAKN